MPPYSVFAGSTLIGHSDLEFGDPSMGVAFGKFRPTSAYSAIRGACIAALATGSWDTLGLGGSHLRRSGRSSAGGVMILDGVDVEPDEIEVHAAGISYPLYAQLFPAHVSAYESRSV